MSDLNDALSRMNDTAPCSNSIINFHREIFMENKPKSI